MLARNDSILTLAALALGLVACGDARPTLGGGGGGGGCTTCHGTAGRTGTLPGTDADLAAAPPVAPAGEPAAVVGAHQAHLNPAATGSLTGPLACANCHVVPTDATHATNPPAQIVQFSLLATTGGITNATWNSNNTTCSNVYCHGNFTFGTVTGTATNAPDWTLGSTQATCGSCHGLPPTGHIALPTPVTAASCNGCHPGTVDTSGNIIVNATNGLSLHINGQSNVSVSCTSCHGTAGRTGTFGGTDPYLASAPPAAPSGEPSQVVGAHQAHLNPGVGSSAGPIACSECHVVPTDSAHATNPPAQIVQFGTLAKTGGASPTWNSPDKVNNTTCSNVYCHGTFTFGTVTGTATNAPDWTLGSTQATCGTCHGLPPTGHISISVGCNGCHPGTVAADGTIIVNATTGASLHVNGQVNEGAHPDPNWLTASGGDHTAAALNQAPPFQTCLACHVNFGPADPNNVAGSSCNDCHGAALAGAATANWQQNCVFCHGDASKIATWTAADPNYEIAPPRGALGETLTTDLVVGAHQKHVNPSSGYNVLSNPIDCTECHPSPLPADISHVNGVVEVPLAGPLATNATGTFVPSPTWNTPVTAGCAATYCHGNYPAGGNNATPIWTTVDGTYAACTSCHGAPPNTGQHYFHMFVQTLIQPMNCSYCHNGIATGSGTSAPVTNAAIVGQTLHVNGVRNVVFPSSFTGATWTPGATPGTGTCSNVACHGTQNW